MPKISGANKVWANKKTGALRKEADRLKDEKYAKRMKIDSRIKEAGLVVGKVFYIVEGDLDKKYLYVIEKIDRVAGLVVLRGKMGGNLKKISVLNKFFISKK